MIRHAVLFRWTAAAAPDQAEQLHAALSAYVADLPGIRSYVHGPNLGINPGAADYAVTADFDTVEDYFRYRDHPRHLEIIAELVAGKADRLAIQIDHPE